MVSNCFIKLHAFNDCVLFLLANIKLKAFLIKVDAYKVVIVLLKFLVFDTVSDPFETVNVSSIEISK